MEPDNDFGWAIAAMRDGQKVTRSGWNGVDMFVKLWEIPVYEGDDTDPCFVLWTAQGTWQPGWHPSQRDCLATDWEIAA